MESILSKGGDICSVLGFIITLVVLFKVGGIQRSFLAQARLPGLRRKIRGHCANLSKFLDDFTSTDPNIATEVRKCHANLQNLLPKLEDKASVKVLVAFTAQLIKATGLPDKEQVRKLHTGLVGLEEELDNLSEDIKWRERK